MWARVIEVMLGCWLAVSPFIFRHAAEETALWRTDLGCALAVVALALLSFWHPLRRAHLAIGLVALWLVGFGYLASPRPVPPAFQNDLVVGLLLLMLAIIPSEASLPPERWRDFSAPSEAHEAGGSLKADVGRGGSGRDDIQEE
jgi:hypothetical protein